MASFDNSYSRLVAWLKILLPLLALAILSTMFLIARTIDPSQTIPFAEVDATELAREQGIGSPNFSSVTNDGSAITIAAESARPDASDQQIVTAQKLTANIETSNGTRIVIVAPTGIIDGTNKQTTLSGGVTMTTTTGYSINTDTIRTLLDATEIVADSTVVATAPMGNINAGSMVLTQQTPATDNQGYLLVFKGGVKLIYQPGK